MAPAVGSTVKQGESMHHPPPQTAAPRSSENLVSQGVGNSMSTIDALEITENVKISRFGNDVASALGAGIIVP
jgi:hypothetical protein